MESQQQPQCHPERSQARSDQELQVEQDDFFISGAQSCVTLVSSETRKVSHVPSIPVLNDVVERTGNMPVKPVMAPVIKSALKPIKLTKSNNEEKEETSLDTLETMKQEISLENDEKLAKMSQEELEILKKEIFESVPESFLNKLRK